MIPEPALFSPALLPSLYEVRNNKRELHDTSTLSLRPLEGKYPRFEPGQFNMLYVFGVGKIPISISSNPAEPDMLKHTVRAVGAVSEALVHLGNKDVVGLRGPLGKGWPVDEAYGHDVLIIAGGLGLAPIRPLIHHLRNFRAEFRRVSILYGARTPDDILYQVPLERWRSQFDLNVQVTVDRASADWLGNVGVVTKLVDTGSFNPRHAKAYVCGPEVMMQFAVMRLNELGVHDGDIFISMERNMRCGVGLCGHCQLGPHFVCRDGPVFRCSEIKPLFQVREL